MSEVKVSGMPFLSPPSSAAWMHQEARSGFEVVFIAPTEGGYLLSGCTTALESDRPWIVDYAIDVDVHWRTRSARVTGRSSASLRTRLLKRHEDDRWRVDGQPTPHLDGCLDVDLESSALTNALPVRRLALPIGATTGAPAAYVRALDLAVERLEQQYTRIEDQDGLQRYDYVAPSFDFSCRLVYDETGLVLTYPGIAVRSG